MGNNEEKEHDHILWVGDDESQGKRNWPAYIEHGFGMMYDGYIPDEEVEAFSSRWGGLDLNSFERVLAEGQGEDKLLAICVIGWSGLPQATQLLLPFVQSFCAKERWLSALCLGRMKEETAFPVLISILTEFLPSPASPLLVEEQAWFDEERIEAAYTLSRWENPSLIPLFRRAYETSVQAERYLPDDPHIPVLTQTWYIYQDVLIRILGRWGAFGVLTGIKLPPYHLQTAVVNFALGYCHLEDLFERWGSAYDWWNDEAFKKILKLVLQQRFGLSEGEQDTYLDAYSKGALARWKYLDQDRRWWLVSQS